MDTLEPLNIIDDRTPEQQMTGGDWDESQKLTRLDTPEPCQIFVGSLARWCGQRAHWNVNNTPVCDYDIQAMAGMNSDNEAFFAPALWERERRRLFFHVMRHPEMKMLRLALRAMRWDHGIDWREIEIQKAEIDPGWTWLFLTDTYQVYSISPGPNVTYEDFHFEYVHRSGDESCKCEMCEYIREFAGLPTLR